MTDFIFLGSKITDAEAEAPVLWLPDVYSQLIGKDPMGRDVDSGGGYAGVGVGA